MNFFHIFKAEGGVKGQSLPNVCCLRAFYIPYTILASSLVIFVVFSGLLNFLSINYFVQSSAFIAFVALFIDNVWEFGGIALHGLSVRSYCYRWILLLSLLLCPNLQLGPAVKDAALTLSAFWCVLAMSSLAILICDFGCQHFVNASHIRSLAMISLATSLISQIFWTLSKFYLGSPAYFTYFIMGCTFDGLVCLQSFALCNMIGSGSKVAGLIQRRPIQVVVAWFSFLLTIRNISNFVMVVTFRSSSDFAHYAEYLHIVFVVAAIVVPWRNCKTTSHQILIDSMECNASFHRGVSEQLRLSIHGIQSFVHPPSNVRVTDRDIEQHQKIDHFCNLVTNILDDETLFHKIDDKDFTAQLDEVAATNFFRDLLKRFEIIATNYPVHFSWNCLAVGSSCGSVYLNTRLAEWPESAVPVDFVLDIDNDVLQQAVSNLISVAFASTPAAGHVKVHTFLSSHRRLEEPPTWLSTLQNEASARFSCEGAISHHPRPGTPLSRSSVLPEPDHHPRSDLNGPHQFLQIRILSLGASESGSGSTAGLNVFPIDPNIFSDGAATWSGMGKSALWLRLVKGL